MVRRLTKAEIRAQIPAARRRAARSLRERPHAIGASVDTHTRMLNVRLLNGCAFSIPVDAIPAIRDIPPRDLEKVEVDAYGYGLRWDKHDMDLEVGGLAKVALGGVTMMRALAASGGSVRSPAKAAAARRNGRKGGRPRQTKRQD